MVFEVVVQLAVAPLLVGAATVAARWWGHGLGGLVSAFPAIVGPVLLIGAHRHGTEFAAQAATGTLLGLAALSGFALAYGRTALHAGSPVSLAAGWLGPTTGGILAALPVLACVLAAFTHARHGGAASAQLLRGMAGFVVFCALVAGLVDHAGVAATFVAATGAAIVTQGAVVWASTRRDPGTRDASESRDAIPSSRLRSGRRGTYRWRNARRDGARPV